jgi:hypothetical protein
MSTTADRYEKRFPGTGCEENQKEERMQRMDFKDEARALRRTSRNRGIIVTGDCPWLRQLEKEKAT